MAMNDLLFILIGQMTIRPQQPVLDMSHQRCLNNNFLVVLLQSMGRCAFHLLVDLIPHVYFNLNSKI